MDTLFIDIHLTFHFYHETLFYLYFFFVSVFLSVEIKEEETEQEKKIVLKKIYSKNILHTCEIKDKQRAKKNHIISVVLFINV